MSRGRIPALRSRSSVSVFSAAAIRRLNDNGFRVIVVSNQAGVARGYFGEDEVHATNEYIREALARQGACIDAFYYCPHHVDGTVVAYRRDCFCRKPNPGMMERAARDYDITLTWSFVVGDRACDIEAGRRAGCRTVLLGDEEIAFPPDFTAPDLPGAVDWILKVAAMVVTNINES